MTRTLLVLGITLAAALPAQADITHKIQSSIQLQVDGAASQASRIGSTLAVSGSNIDFASGSVPTLGTLTSGSAVGYTAGDYAIKNAGEAFSYSESFIEGDDSATSTSVTTSSGNVDSLPLFGSNVVQSGGVAGNLAGSIDSSGSISLTAGGAGTTATGQVVTEITVD